ncbi:hypothetical protein APHAL10511_007349 [Amanita phalloides]|nr:hypothetical protein APHAL10511_007349 [Amanita phalloides]
MSSLATSDHVLYRSHSNSSVSSSSSSSSLARRPSIRRSRLRNNGGYVHKSPSELPYLDKPSVQEQGQLLRPPEQDAQEQRDLHARASGSLQSSEGVALDVTMVADAQPSPMVAKLSKALEKASSLPDIITSHNPPSSALFHEPCLTPIANMRDSVSTQQSGTSSSVYPLSISSASGPDSPTSLRTMSEDIEHFEVSSFEPDVEELPDFDPDDVSYRLRLLVKNNYFLPPAHSKPALSELSPSDTTRKSNRAATPTFLDIFRVNKSKSKPASPVVETILPMLRATGDSIMAPHLPQPRVSTQIPRPSLNVVVNDRVGRVVVVREKMEDISLAAKQAEQEIKSRAHVRRDLNPLDLGVPDVPIDPTDAVDIPPPPPFYPFPMQTSTLHGLGVTESIGAAILAEHLPPGSPGLSSIDATDDWRRVLLQEAVHHSLDNSADLSSFSQVIGISTPVASPQGKESRSSEVSPTPTPRILLQQRIMKQAFPDSSDDSFRDVRQEKASASKTMLSKGTTVGVSERLSVSQRVPSNRSSYLPARVDTPTDPLTALTPPPPRKQVTASQSQTDLRMSKTAELIERQCRTPTPTLRKSASSAMLSDGHRSDILRPNRITPPPLSNASVHPEDSSLESKNASGNTRITMTESMYSEDEYADGSGRQSSSLSAPMSRPSLSEYSRYSLSPTTSAFQEDLNNAHGYPSSHSTSQESEQISTIRDSPLPRDTTMSPPPRISSSLAHVALSPPPRAASLRHPSLPARRGSHPQQSIKSSLDSVMELGDPRPSTPPLLSDSRENSSTMSPAIRTAEHGNVDASLHTAPAPSSPTSFFDNIQSQPNALDDLDSSSDEGGAVHATIYSDVRSRTMSNVSSPSKSLLMRLGNHSTPYFSRTTRSADDHHGPLPFGVQDPKQPIVNMPQQGQSSAQQRIAKGDNGRGAPVTSFDFYEYSKQHWSGLSTDFSETRRPATAGESRPTGKKANSVANESLRRLDGLVQQHMEAEKDTMKRIAKTLQSANNQGTGIHNT